MVLPEEEADEAGRDHLCGFRRLADTETTHDGGMVAKSIKRSMQISWCLRIPPEIPTTNAFPRFESGAGFFAHPHYVATKANGTLRDVTFRRTLKSRVTKQDISVHRSRYGFDMSVHPVQTYTHT